MARGGFRAMAEELARDINRHATVVLAGARALQPAPHGGQPGTSGASTSGQAPGPSGGDGDGALDELAAARLRGYGAGLEDLRAPVAQRVEALRITAPGAYFGGRAGGGDDGGGEGGRAEGRRAQAAQAAQGQQGAGGAAGGGGGCVAALRLLSSVDPNNLPCPPVPSFSAYEVRGGGREGGRSAARVCALGAWSLPFARICPCACHSRTHASAGCPRHPLLARIAATRATSSPSSPRTLAARCAPLPRRRCWTCAA